MREYGWVSLSGLVWGVLLWFVNPMAFWWMSPVLLGLVASIPLAVMTSIQLADTNALFRTPDESAPDYILQQFAVNHTELLHHPCISTRDLFIRVVVDPLAFQKHMTYIPQRTNVPSSTRQQRHEWLERLLEQGPSSISNSERLVILEDAEMLTQLHAQVWQLPETQFNEQWMSRL